MSEKEPTPISRGIELQKSQVEKLQQKALAQHRILVDLDKVLEAKIDAALSVPSDESTVELVELFKQKRALEEIGHELEELILQGFDHYGQLQERWLALEQRLSDLEQK